MKNRSTLQSLLIGMFVVLVLAAFNSSVRAVVCLAGSGTTWTNSLGGSWFDCTNNWDNGCPSTEKCVFINNGGEATVDDYAQAFSLTLGDGQGESGSVVVDGGDLQIDPAFPYDCPAPFTWAIKGQAL